MKSKDILRPGGCIQSINTNNKLCVDTKTPYAKIYRNGKQVWAQGGGYLPVHLNMQVKNLFGFRLKLSAKKITLFCSRTTILFCTIRPAKLYGNREQIALAKRWGFCK